MKQQWAVPALVANILFMAIIILFVKRKNGGLRAATILLAFDIAN